MTKVQKRGNMLIFQVNVTIEIKFIKSKFMPVKII